MGAVLTIPTNLAQGAGAEWPDWLTQLPTMVAGAVDRWQLRLDTPFEPGGQTSWVAPALDLDNRSVVLKVTANFPESRDEPVLLELLGGNRAVRLWDWYRAGDSTVLLLDRIRPGGQLGELLPEPKRDAVLVQTLRALWETPVPDKVFRPLSAMTTYWADQFEQDLDARQRDTDPGLIRAGIELFRRLPLESTDVVPLGTDVHEENILLDEARGWMLIDPKPYVGDRHYDLIQYMLNCSRLRIDPLGLVRRLADLAGLDPEVLQLWAFARCVQESGEFPDALAAARLLAP